MKKFIIPAIALLIAATSVNAQTSPAKSKAKQTTSHTVKASSAKTASAAKDSTKTASKSVAKKHTAMSKKKAPK